MFGECGFLSYFYLIHLGQENGTDSEVMSLRDALQKVERGGLVDFKLGGHRCERPPEVQQGRADDRFVITSDPENPLLWKANAVQVRNFKQNNIASHFPYSKLKDSPLQLDPRQQFFKVFMFAMLIHCHLF